MGIPKSPPSVLLALLFSLGSPLKTTCVISNSHHWWSGVFWFKSQEQIRGGSKKFLGGSLLEAMLGLVDGAIVPPIPTPCTQTVGGGRAGYHLSIFGQDFRNF